MTLYSANDRPLRRVIGFWQPDTYVEVEDGDKDTINWPAPRPTLDLDLDTQVRSSTDRMTAS